MDTMLMEGIIQAARKDPAISKLFLFGSHARGLATVFSDVDVAVVTTGSPNRAMLNRAASHPHMDINFTYIDADTFQTDDHCLHVTSSIKREGVLLWQR